ncbi:MAG: ABC transporter substrate-binding protein, partial [Acidimicrobiia bacterium]
GEVRDGVRVVTDALGEVEVPLRPERIVVLDTGELDAAAAVGVKPVGVVEVGNHLVVPPHLTATAEGAADVGTIATPNLEAIRRLDPDLILGNLERDDEIRDELATIAPTVMGADIGPRWRRNAELYTAAMGRCTEAAAAFAAYDRAVADLRADLGDDAADIEVSVVRAVFDRVRIYGRASYIGSILDEVGLSRPPAQSRDVLMEEVGIERIADMDGDVMFVTQWGPIQPAFDQIKANPIWSSLEVVRADRIHPVEDSTWMLALGVYGATSVIDDLRAALVTS